MSEVALADSWHWASMILATSRLKDHEGYEALARLRMPGPDYYETLAYIHRALKPRKYVEVGVRDGQSLRCADRDTEVIAIEPHPVAEAWQHCQSLCATLAVATSDEFFANERQRERVSGFDLAFIDGDHDAEQVRRDFENLEALAHPGSLILLHDVVPMDAQTSTPKQNSSFWTGDVWRVMAALVEGRPDLIAFTIACPPTGLGVLGRFGQPSLSRSKPWWGSRPAGTPFGYDVGCVIDRVGWNWDATRSKLRIVPNEADAIKQAFAGEYPMSEVSA